MLVETNPQNGPFKIGDTVKVKSTGQVGTIVGHRNGLWEVEVVNHNKMMVEAAQLEPKQVLFG